MERDRYAQSRQLYLIGLMSLILGLCLIAFCLYLLPAIWFGWQYEIPEFIAHFAHWFELNYGFSSENAYYTVWIIFFLIGLDGIFMAWFASSRIDRMILAHELPEEESGEVITEADKLRRMEKYRVSAGISLKILFIILLVFVVIALVEWLIYVPPPI